MKKNFRQGDVMLHGINEIPSDAKQTKEKSRVLAWGEVTGHKHVLHGQGCSFFEMGDQTFTVVEEGSTGALDHEEHAHIDVEPGKYEVIIQREFDLLEGIREVMD